LTHNEKNSDGKEKPLILFSALDWGLGHTTRSIPLVRELLQQGLKVIVACNSTQKQILEKEIYGLEFIHLEGYGLKYGRNRLTTRIKIMLQAKKILTRIKGENQWLASFLTENPVKAVISDNRYGLFAPGIPCMLITHQLQVKTGFGTFPDKLVQLFLSEYINKFTECWIPDFKNETNLAGKLSHPSRPPRLPVRYIGCLSRFKDCKLLSHSTESNDLLIILSGPEPQRTILEDKVVRQLKAQKRKAVLVRGLPAERGKLEDIEGLQIFNYLAADKLNELICNSRLIICRSGYTSIMDILKLRKKMIVVPTPGQAEQEYLASHLSGRKLAAKMQQNKFSIEAALQIAEGFKFEFIEENMEAYKEVIKDFALQITSSNQS
jgi:uncharacterized protein (TIGR00661 family)